MRSKHASKGQRAHSPGQRPGYDEVMKCALKGQKRLYKRLHANAFAPSGRTSSLHHTQGDALGYVLVAPSGRALNACFPSGRALNAWFPSGRALNAWFPSGRALNACAYSLIQLAKRE